MARSGRFGSLPAAAQDLSATIASMVAQYENARDRNIETAWQQGGKFEGAKVTDKRFLAWWHARRREVSSDDPMADYYDQAIHNYRFQIGEQKMTLAYTQGKASEMDVARFYVHEAGRVPRDSAVWRDLMTNAARFQKAAAQKRHAAAGQSASERFQAQWSALDKQYISPVGKAEGVIDEITQSAVAVQNIWGVSPGMREGLDLDAVLSQIETDPATAAMWPKWRARLEAADPSFHGHLTIGYLGHVYQRGKMGARKQAELARRFGYTSYEQSAHKTMDTYDKAADGLSVWDEAQKAQQWYQTAISQGINDAGRTPQERAAARASLLTKLSGLQQRALREGKTVFAGKLLEDMRTLQGDKRGGQREGVITASSLSSMSGLQEGSAQAEALLAEQANTDNEDIQKLDDGSAVLVAGTDAAGKPTLTVTPRSAVITNDPSNVATQVVGTPGYTTIDSKGHKQVVGGGATTIVRNGMPVRVQVGDPSSLDPGGYAHSVQNRDDRTGIVGWRFDLGDGRVAWQLIQGDGSKVWTTDDPFDDSMVRSQGVNSGQGGDEWLVTADPNLQDTQTVPGATADSADVHVADPRAVLKDQFELTPEQRQQQQQLRADAERRQTSTLAPGLDSSGFSAEQRAKFGSLSVENQRFLVDRGLTGIPADQMTDQRLNVARQGGTNVPLAWRPTKRRAGVDTVDAQGQPTDQQEKARRDLYGIEQRLDALGTWVPAGDHADEIRGLLAQRQRIIDGAGFPPEVVSLYAQRKSASDGSGLGMGVVLGKQEDPKVTAQRKVDIQTEIDRRVTTEGGDTTPYTDPVARLTEIDKQIRGIDAEVGAGADPAVRAIVGGVAGTDYASARKALVDERTKLLGTSSVKGYTTASAGAFSVRGSVEQATQVRQWMTNIGVTDGKNPTPREQPNGYTTFTALYYSDSQQRRAELAKLTDDQVRVQMLLSDPGFLTDPLALQKAMGEIDLIRRNANVDNATYTRDRMQSDGLPGPIANAMTSPMQAAYDRHMQEEMRKGHIFAEPASVFGGGGDGTGGDGSTAVNPADAAFIWGGGKQPAAAPAFFDPKAGLDKADRFALTDRPTLKLPSWTNVWGTGNISAQQALDENRRLAEERQSRSKPGYDPLTRAPIPPTFGAHAKPQPVVKVAKQPKPDKPPPTAPPPKKLPKPASQMPQNPAYSGAREVAGGHSGEGTGAGRYSPSGAGRVTGI